MPRDDVRPTSERARQAYFNIVGTRVHDARFLDLFAGSGIFAFEAVSRGAREAVAIDSGRAHTTAIGKTAQQLEVPVTALTADVMTSLARLGGPPFDLVYADPPYEWEKYDELLTAIDTQLPLAPDALVAIEHRRGTEPFQATLTKLQHTRRAEYGEVWISFFIHEAA